MLVLDEAGFNALDDSEKLMFAKNDEGKFALGKPEDVSGLKSTLAKYKEKNSAAESQMTELTQALKDAKGGLSDEEHGSLLSLIRDGQQKDAVKLLAEGRTEEVIEILAGEKMRQLTTQLESVTSERDEYAGKNSGLKVNQAFSEIVGGDVKFIGNHEGNELMRNDLLQIFKGSMLETDEGLFVKNPSNPKEVLLTDKGEKVTPKLWYELQRQTRPNFFVGTMASDQQHLQKNANGGIDLSKLATGSKISAARAATSQQ